MTYQQFWYGDAELVVAYREAHKLKIQQKNEELWLQGLYIYNAFGVVLANAFKTKGATPYKYIEKPLDIFPKPAPTEAEQEKAREDVIKALSRWKKSWDAVKGKDNNASR